MTDGARRSSTSLRWPPLTAAIGALLWGWSHLIGGMLIAANGRVDLIGLPAGAFRLAVQRREHNSRGWLLAGPTCEFELAEGAGVREVAVLRW